MRGVTTGLFLLAATVAAAQASDLARHSAHPLHLTRAFALTMHENRAPAASRDAGPLLGHAATHYEARPSGLDRFDPASMRMFGGQIGGNGVKGGAVVSLTWPTE